jgi:sigma-B regulation protein RsbU (phosphoserine phosphatase)
MIGAGITTPYDQAGFRLRPDDRLFVYTDGLVEVRNPYAEPYTKQRLIKALRNNAHLPIDDLVDVACADVAAFRQGNPPDDDMTILGIEYSP